MAITGRGGTLPGMPRRPLSELECFVLGLIWKDGPCTAYALRQKLQASPSTQWSGSAGAIYPLVRRLERAGLLKSKPSGRGRRASLEYVTTQKGEAALRTWIGPPLPPEAVTVTHDPIRSRLRFLSALPPQQRRAWIEAALAALEDLSGRVKAWALAHADDADPFTAILTRSGELDIQARATWLREARRKTPQ
jgi:DNA-binding PadR family transcriptional regulator